ncbi:hypothetical protein IW138_003623 [Coemansia sp. RSA 986]|nr:hypothetical protein LPJ74_002332 [Coemansia sp. RSA 1843]KAJ2089165.1 hypothetical protein IW138_003623 [Coemansia sp. RSA 986]
MYGKGKTAAIIKLTWTPIGRLTEGAVYEILTKANVPNTPKVLDSGILKKDVFGYRFEYIIMEDCGDTIMNFGQARYENGQASKASGLVSKHIAQVSSCLIHAQAAGVFHRDISSGNIAISSQGNASVIDWGYAKVVKPDNAGVMKRNEAALRKWHLDPELIIQMEANYDMLTGTPQYISIQMLVSDKERGLIHDLESLFYVILHVLSNRTEEEPRGFKCFDSHDFAWARVGYLSERGHFYDSFGVEIGGVNKALRRVLDAMYCFLFTKDGRYIGGKLLYKKNFRRELCREYAKRFVDQVALQLMLPESNDDTTTVTEAGRKSSLPKRKQSDKDNVDKENLQNKRLCV